MTAAVQEILNQINRLSEADRLLLEDWERQAADVRRLANERGIDQAAVDNAIEDLRYH